MECSMQFSTTIPRGAPFRAFSTDRLRCPRGASFVPRGATASFWCHRSVIWRPGARVSAHAASSEGEAHSGPKRLEEEYDVIGPKAVLLIGLSQVDGKIVQDWVAQMDPSYKVWPVKRHQVEGNVSLESILLNPPAANEDWPVYGTRTPPLVIFSGTTGLDMIAVITHWTQYTGLELPAFASTCKANMNKSLSKLIPEIVRSMNVARMGEENPDLIKLPDEYKKQEEEDKASPKVPNFMGGADAPDPFVVSGDEDLLRLREQLRAKFNNRDENRHLLKKQMMNEQSQERRRQRTSHRDDAPFKGFGPKKA